MNDHLGNKIPDYRTIGIKFWNGKRVTCIQSVG